MLSSDETEVINGKVYPTWWLDTPDAEIHFAFTGKQKDPQGQDKEISDDQAPEERCEFPSGEEYL